MIGTMKNAATQPSNRYNGTPTHAGADGQHIFNSTPAKAPAQTIQNSTMPCLDGNASRANGV